MSAGDKSQLSVEGGLQDGIIITVLLKYSSYIT